MEAKKISFGFMKTKKVEKPIIEEKKEFIECMEEKSIKVVGEEEIKEIAPLVIPMKPNTLVTADRMKQIADEVESVLNEPETHEKKSTKQEVAPENETLDQMVVRELLQDAKKEVKIEETKELTVPIPAQPVLHGKKESTLEDYEDVPVQEFGLAMLRGMGWTPSKEKSSYKQPQLRPKGLGLGADKVVTEKKKTAVSEKGEELTIVKNSYVKITTGKYSGYYGKVVSLDEDNGRVMVDLTVKKETVSLSEFMMQPVTKSQFDKESKVINADSFEEYKRAENDPQKTSRHDPAKDNREATTSKKHSKNGDPSNERDIRKENERSSRKEDERSSRKEDDKRLRKNDDRISRKEDDRSSKKETRDRRQRDKYTRDSSDSEDDEKTSRKETRDIRRQDKDKRDSSDSEQRSRKLKKEKKKKRRHSSSDSFSSLSDSDRKKHKSSKKCYTSTETDSDSPKREKQKRTQEKKRDIDKKRKGKKKKRDRDRSPNYKKHRKLIN